MASSVTHGWLGSCRNSGLSHKQYGWKRFHFTRELRTFLNWMVFFDVNLKRLDECQGRPSRRGGWPAEAQERGVTATPSESITFLPDLSLLSFTRLVISRLCTIAHDKASACLKKYSCIHLLCLLYMCLWRSCPLCARQKYCCSGSYRIQLNPTCSFHEGKPKHTLAPLSPGVSAFISALVLVMQVSCCLAQH